MSVHVQRAVDVCTIGGSQCVIRAQSDPALRIAVGIVNLNVSGECFVGSLPQFDPAGTVLER